MCTVLLPPGGNPIAVNIYHIISFNDATSAACVASKHSVSAAEDLREAVVVQLDILQGVYFILELSCCTSTVSCGRSAVGRPKTVSEPTGSDKTLNT